MDSYQAIYDAVRSRILGGDVGGAIHEHLSALNLGFYFERAAGELAQAASEHQRPSAVYRPKIYMDGDQWCALYGENLQDGVAGFGKSPDQAMRAFDAAWHTEAA